MRVQVSHRVAVHEGYRSARVRSLFNADSADFSLAADLPIDDFDWQIGLVVGPSGSGKSSLAREIWPDVTVHTPSWPDHLPMVEALGPDAAFDDVTAALSAVGLGSVPAWLRPYRLLSTGERFRADLARLLVDRPARAKVDEFTSVVDRQVAKVGAHAFGKAWRRGPGQVVLFSCHYDVADWLEPCWVFDTATGRYAGRGLWRRPRFELEIIETNWSWWPRFEPHHYLKLPRMIAAKCYVGLVECTPVAHVGFSTCVGLREARACRLVVMPEWQGAGVGMRFLNEICRRWLAGQNPYRLRLPTLLHTSHPGLCAALRRDPGWVQVSARLHGENKARSQASMAKSGRSSPAGFGGHFRAVQGFRYVGRPS